MLEDISNHLIRNQSQRKNDFFLNKLYHKRRVGIHHVPTEFINLMNLQLSHISTRVEREVRGKRTINE